jgi:hypothetical protein
MRLSKTLTGLLMPIAIFSITIPVQATTVSMEPFSVHQVSVVEKNSVKFKAKIVQMKIPTKAYYNPKTGKTLVVNVRKTKFFKARHKSSSVPVEVKVNGKWVKVGYRYLKRSNTLIFDEYTRKRFGLPKKDVLGTKPAKIVGATPNGVNDSTTGVTTFEGDGFTIEFGGGDIALPTPTVYTAPLPEQGAELLAFSNSTRAKNGLPPLIVCSNLNAAADHWAKRVAPVSVNDGGNLDINGVSWTFAKQIMNYKYTTAKKSKAGANFTDVLIDPRWPTEYPFWSIPGLEAKWDHIGLGTALTDKNTVLWIMIAGSGGNCSN